MKRAIVPFVALACLLMFGCATAVSVQVTKPAELNMQGAKSIAILPFAFPSQVQMPGLSPYQAAILRLWILDSRENPIERNVAKFAESVFTSALLDSKFYTVIKSDDLKNLVAANDPNAKINADAVITGAIVGLTSNVSDKSFKDKNGKLIPSFENWVTVELRFDVIQTATNQILASKSLSASSTASGLADYYSAQNKTEELAKGMIRNWSTVIQHSLAPYVVTEARFLADDEKKDPQMEQAKKLVTDGFYQKAFDMYADIYGRTKNFAAGFNAAIMKEILGDLAGAIADMDALANASANPKALNEAKRMRTTLAEIQKSEAQKAGR